MSEELARRARALAQAGTTYVEIAEQFNADGIERDGKAHTWTRASVQEMILENNEEIERAASGPTQGSSWRTPTGQPPADHAFAMLLQWALIILGGLAVIGGVVVGVQASKRTGDYSYLHHTNHDASILWAWIIAGIIQMIVYWSLAAGLGLLRDIAQRRS